MYSHFSNKVHLKCIIYEHWCALQYSWGALIVSLSFNNSAKVSKALFGFSEFGFQSFRTQVISYPSHFVPTLVISYSLFYHFVHSNNHFVPSLVISYLDQMDTKWLCGTVETELKVTISAPHEHLQCTSMLINIQMRCTLLEEWECINFIFSVLSKLSLICVAKTIFCHKIWASFLMF